MIPNKPQLPIFFLSQSIKKSNVVDHFDLLCILNVLIRIRGKSGDFSITDGLLIFYNRLDKTEIINQPKSTKYSKFLGIREW